MNLVSYSLRTKGAHNFIRRLRTVFTRFGISESRGRRGLLSIIDTLKHYQSAPTFFIPAVVLGRHPTLIARIARDGAEIGVHGYVHNDYRTLNKEQQFKQTEKAISIFQKNHIPYYGFRNPYLGWNADSLEVFASLGFRYESNIAVLHGVVDLHSFSPLLRSGFAKSLELFQAIPCNRYNLLPQFDEQILRIPTSIPDDEILFDRLRITDPLEVGQIWSKIMQRVYDQGGLYTLNLHPERGFLCRRALDTLLAYARGLELPVWIARIGEIAQWWKGRNQFRMKLTSEGDSRWRVEASCSEQATILARHLTVDGSEVTPWHGDDERVSAQTFSVNAPLIPCIGLSARTPAELEQFLYEQGYPVMRCVAEDASLYALYLDRPAGLGLTMEEQQESRIALVDQIENLERPFLHFGCWPGGQRAALCISGDIDSITVQDFFLRIVEVSRNR